MATIWRSVWIVVLELLLLCVAQGLWLSGGSAWLSGMIRVTYILLLGAASGAGDLLVRAREEPGPKSPSRRPLGKEDGHAGPRFGASSVTPFPP